jgi:hypothetical protein
VGNFLTSWEPVSLSRSTVLHGVDKLVSQAAYHRKGGWYIFHNVELAGCGVNWGIVSTFVWRNRETLWVQNNMFRPEIEPGFIRIRQKRGWLIVVGHCYWTNRLPWGHRVFVCFMWISAQTAIISLHSINWLVFITEI